MNKTLKYARRVVALAALAVMTVWLTTASTSLMLSMGWIARVQFVPAMLSASFATVLFIVALTLIFGRLYCSTVCPLGTIQDIASRLRRFTHRAANRHAFHYSHPHNRVRLATVVVIVAASIAGSSLLLALLDPYGSFGRFATWIFRPIIGTGDFATATSAAFVGFIAAVVILIVVVMLAASHGRLWCNTMCPVGSVLGTVSRISLMHIDINTDRCINCRRCEHACKSSCIDLESHVIDMSRCVVCFDCLPPCPNDAIHYTARRHRLSIPMMMRVDTPKIVTDITTPQSPLHITRRRFIASSALLAATPLLNTLLNTSSVSAASQLSALRAPHRARPVPPPGAQSIDSLLHRCVGCGACSSVCPEKIIIPSSGQWGVAHLLVPHLDFSLGHCLYDCNRCTHVCPTHALSPMTLIDKQHTAIGLATVDADRCIGCGRCERACPTRAITMIGNPSYSTSGAHGSKAARIAHVDHSDCIGCGACQNTCPVDPAAIIVNGLQR